jgi:hypothetical protein
MQALAKRVLTDDRVARLLLQDVEPQPDLYPDLYQGCRDRMQVTSDFHRQRMNDA